MITHILAVFVAGIGTMALGALWYSPLLFAEPWMKANGYTAESLEASKDSMGRTYALSFVAYLVMAAILSILLNWLHVDTLLDGLHVGALCWLGFAATIGLTANLFSEKPLMAWIIDAGYQLVYMLFMGALLGVWR
jgi:hypothetical protein